MKTSKVVRSKQPNNGLWGTYFVSVFSMVLCGVMFLGTTYAWFNASNTSVGNVVESGVLNVDMFHLTGGEKISLSTESKHCVFSSAVEWGPGRTQMETIEVYNAGDLPAYCKVDFVEDENNSKVLSKTAKEQFLVYVKVGSVEAGETVTGTGWSSLGTLDAVMTNNTLLFKTDKTDAIQENDEISSQESQTFSIALRMVDNPTTDIMGESGNIYLRLVAEQVVQR